MQIQQLEPRRLLSVSLANSILRIGGTDAADNIFVDTRPVMKTGNTMHYGFVVHVNDEATPIGAVSLKKIIVDGGAGNDTIIIPRVLTTMRSIPLRAGQTAVDTHLSVAGIASGGAGDDTVIGGRRADTLNGGDGNDLVIGGEGVDQMHGDAGNDNLNGQAGDDRLWGDDGNDNMIGETGANMFSGGNGSDTADYSARTDDLVIAMTNSLSDDQLDSANGDADRILRDVENLNGGSGDDALTGNYFNNVINGGGGNDTLVGAEGNDMLNGGPGNDSFESSDRYVQTNFDNSGKPSTTGNGTVFRGRDVLIGGGGNDHANIDAKDSTKDIEDIVNG